MEWYISAHRTDGTEILGNLDFQGRINARDYKRTNRYKALVKWAEQINSGHNPARVYYWTIRAGYNGRPVQYVYTETAKYDIWKGTFGAGAQLADMLKK